MRTTWLARELLKLLPHSNSEGGSSKTKRYRIYGEYRAVLLESRMLTGDHFAGLGYLPMIQFDSDMKSKPCTSGWVNCNFRFLCLVPMPRYIFQELEKVFVAELEMRAAVDEPRWTDNWTIREAEKEMMLRDAGDLRTIHGEEWYAAFGDGPTEKSYAHSADLSADQERQLAAMLTEVAELKKDLDLPEYAFRDSDSDAPAEPSDDSPTSTDEDA